MIVDVHRHYMPEELYERYGSLNKPTWRYNDPVLEFTFYNKLYQVDCLKAAGRALVSQKWEE